MKKHITVRKCIAERYFFRGCSLFMSLLDIIIIIEQEFLLLLMFFPVMLAIVFCLMYMESWKITFSPQFVEKKIFGKTIARYPYSLLSGARLSYSATNHENVTLTFFKNRKIRFRMKDENATNALKLIRSHKSITQ